MSKLSSSFAAAALGRRDVMRMMAGSATLLMPRMLPAAGKNWWVYIGTYDEGSVAGKGAKGIYVARFDTGTGKLTEPELAAENPNPNWFLVHPNGRTMYVTNELMAPAQGSNPPPGTITVYSLDRKTGKIKETAKVQSGGEQPCHMVFDRTAKMLIVANWYVGNVSAFPVNKDGSLGERSILAKQEGERSGPPAGAPQTHCHCLIVSPDNRFLLACNTGLNKIFVYNLDPAKHTFTPHDPPFLGLQKVTNPRHMALHPNHKWIYIANEVAPGGCTMVTFDAAKGTLEEGPVFASLPPGAAGGRGAQAEVVVHPSGKFVYISNRGASSLGVFQVNQSDGKLTLMEAFSPGGSTPRSFALDPTGMWLLSLMQRTGEVAVLKIDQETGKLSDTGQKYNLGAPICAEFVAMA
jgi:6-phosphogluconolactonase